MSISQVTKGAAQYTSTQAGEIAAKSDEGRGIERPDKAEVSGKKDDSIGWQAMKKLGKMGLAAAKGIGIGGYRLVKGFGKGVYHTQEGIYGKKAGILGNILLLTALGGAVAGGVLAGGAGAVGGALLGTTWYHMGGGLVGAAKEVVHPGA